MFRQNSSQYKTTFENVKRNLIVRNFFEPEQTYLKKLAGNRVGCQLKPLQVLEKFTQEITKTRNNYQKKNKIISANFSSK